MPITRFEHPSSIGDCAVAAADDREGGTRNARPPCKNMCVEQLVAGRPLVSSLDHLPKFWCRDISLSRLVAWPQYLDEVFRKIVPWWGWKQGRQAGRHEWVLACSQRQGMQCSCQSMIVGWLIGSLLHVLCSIFWSSWKIISNKVQCATIRTKVGAAFWSFISENSWMSNSLKLCTNPFVCSLKPNNFLNSSYALM
jgi:hypothetical protein